MMTGLIDKISGGLNFKDMGDSAIVFILSVFTTFIIIVFGIYFMYMYNLQTNECKAMRNIYPIRNTTINSIVPTTQLLNAYCIKSAYNCCSLGSYKNDYVGTCILTHILQQGVRFLDFEIFSVDDMPVVATSVSNNFHEKETFNSVNFNDVMKTIQNTAFSPNLVGNYSDPIIIHLRFKSNNPKMFDALLVIFKFYSSMFVDKSLSISNTTPIDFTTVPVSSIMGKISVFVDDSNKVCTLCSALKEFINMRSNGSSSLRIYPFYDIRNASQPDLFDMLSFNTKMTTANNVTTKSEINKGMTICIPNRDINPGNPNLSVTQSIDCNIVAMRFQHVDENLIAYNNTFKYNAFILKTAMPNYSSTVTHL